MVAFNLLSDSIYVMAAKSDEKQSYVTGRITITMSTDEDDILQELFKDLFQRDERRRSSKRKSEKEKDKDVQPLSESGLSTLECRDRTLSVKSMSSYSQSEPKQRQVAREKEPMPPKRQPSPPGKAGKNKKSKRNLNFQLKVFVFQKLFDCMYFRIVD